MEVVVGAHSFTKAFVATGLWRLGLGVLALGVLGSSGFIFADIGSEFQIEVQALRVEGVRTESIPV